ncbi:VTT domain-containing protein [Sphingomonas sp. HF-S3]|uniref:VTT domain-containing protein n=1 Tax=Sphingomonas rustica TaxID=3103142 RepID=A0ABV0BCB2_9SPHN
MIAAPRTVPRLLGAALLLLSLVLVPFFLVGGPLERVSDDILSGQRGVAAIGGATLLALDIVLPVPSSVVATAMGAMLGGPAGALVNATGLTIGCILGLFLGQAGTPVARRMLGETGYAQFTGWARRHGVLALVLCRAVPVLAEASVIALGSAGGRRMPLIAAAALADIGLGGVYAFAGAASGPAAAPALPAVAAALGLPAVALLAVSAWIRWTR